MDVMAGSAPTREDIDIRALSTCEWRVSDKRVPPGDAGCVLGFIEKNGDVFEVMQLGRGFAWYRFGSWDEATAHFTHPSADADHSLDASVYGSVVEEHELSWMTHA